MCCWHQLPSGLSRHAGQSRGQLTPYSLESYVYESSYDCGLQLYRPYVAITSMAQVLTVVNPSQIYRLLNARLSQDQMLAHLCFYSLALSNQYYVPVPWQGAYSIQEIPLWRKDELTIVFSSQWDFLYWQEHLYVDSGPCSPGHYLHPTFSLCYSCPRGQYQDMDGATECIFCPSGTTTDTTGSTSLNDCEGESQTQYSHVIYRWVCARKT